MEYVFGKFFASYFTFNGFQYFSIWIFCVFQFTLLRERVQNHLLSVLEEITFFLRSEIPANLRMVRGTIIGQRINQVFLEICIVALELLEIPVLLMILIFVNKWISNFLVLCFLVHFIIVQFCVWLMSWAPESLEQFLGNIAKQPQNKQLKKITKKNK